MPVVAVARYAMNTRFEVVLHGANPVALRAAADAALDEIERLEAQLSLFRPTSEIARINRRAALEPVRVSPPVFRLLRQAQTLSVETQGAFDPTVAPVLHAWGFLGGCGSSAREDELAAARELVGMHGVDLDEATFSVRFPRAGMMLDLGAIGKGYAIDCAAEVLREAGVTSAFIHGGTSSCYGLGAPEDAVAWRVAINRPHADKPAADYTPPLPSHLPAVLPPPSAAGPVTLSQATAILALRDDSLGVSETGSKMIRAGNRAYGHVMDPRSGEPVHRAVLAAVALPSATETDALSTALITLGSEGLPMLKALRPHGRFLVVEPPDSVGRWPLHNSGFDLPG